MPVPRHRAGDNPLNALVEQPIIVAPKPSAKIARPEPVGESQSGDFHFSESLPVFQQPWWFEIAARDEDRREFTVRHEGVVVGRLPFVVVTDRIGNRLGFPPIWSRLGGPTVSQELDRGEKGAVLRRLLAQLPRSISFKFVCSASGGDVDLKREAFLAEGFDHRVETTYVQLPQDPGILSRLNAKHRGHIRRADRDLEVVQIGADPFIEFYQANLKAAGKESYASMKNARDLIAMGQDRETPQVRAYAARRKSAGAPLDAAIACAWDDERYYLWMTTRRRASASDSVAKPHSDAIKFLVLAATEHAQSLNLVFDVDGATTEGARNLYRDILKFPRVESRDVFIRDTRIYSVYKRIRPNRIIHPPYPQSA
jgi:hypothetical protein